jgi:hypothetical protein
MLRDNCTASEMIPIRLLMSITIISAIMLLAFVGFQRIDTTTEMQRFEDELVVLRSELSLLCKTGESRDVRNPGAPSGSTRVFSFHIPSSLSTLSFGSYPWVSSSMDQYESDISSGIFYQNTLGETKALWCDSSIIFRKGIYQDSRWITSDETPYFTFSDSATLTVTFEKVYDTASTVIIIY